jgi:hypothetical protein
MPLLEQTSALQVIAPELFNPTVNPTIDAALGLADIRTSQSAFGVKRDLAVAYLAAHMLTLAGRRGYGGAIIGLKEGDLAVQYGGGRQESRALEATSYGLELIQLRDENIFGTTVTPPVPPDAEIL